MLTSKAQRRRGSPSLYSCLVWVLAELGTSGENSYCWEEINLPHHPHGVDWAPPLLNIHGSLSYWWTALSPELCVSDSGRERTGGQKGMVSVQLWNHSIEQLAHTIGQTAAKVALKTETRNQEILLLLELQLKEIGLCPFWSPVTFFFFFFLQPLY